MLDLNNLPTNQKSIRQVFYGNASTVGTSWVAWVKPRGINFIRIVCIGGGGGGGGGFAGTTTVGTAGGGGGGASGAMAARIFPAFVLPDVLYVSVGIGGAGGAVSANGTSGIASYVALTESTTPANNVLLYAVAGPFGSAAAAGGNAGTATAGPSTPNAIAALLGFGYGTLTTSIGVAGSSGSSGRTNGTAGLTVTLSTTGIILTGGCGGGGYASAANTAGADGGSFVVPANDIFPALIGGTGGLSTGTAGENGSNGVQINKLLYFMGGTGGGGAGQGATGNTGLSGGAGGAGAYGCGGGGGGGGFTGSTGGRGGKGGDGLVIINAW